MILRCDTVNDILLENGFKGILWMAFVREFESQIWKKKVIENRQDFVSHQAGGCLRRSKAGSGCGSLPMLARRTWTNILENINKYCPIIWTNTSWIWLCFQIDWELGPVWNWFGRDNPTGISHGWQSISNNLSFSYNLVSFWAFTSYSFFFILQKTAFKLVKSRLALWQITRKERGIIGPASLLHSW